MLKLLNVIFRETGQVLSELATACSGRVFMASWVLHTDEPRPGELQLAGRVDLVQNL